MGVYNVVFSEKEKREYLNVIIEGLDHGKTDNEIAKEIGISNNSVKRFREELIQTGEITEERIEAGKQWLEKEKEKVKKKEMQEVLECLKKGMTVIEIVNELNMVEGRVKGYKKELIASNAITRQQISQAKSNKGSKGKDNSILESGRKSVYTYVSERLEEKVLILLQLGWTANNICNSLGIDNETFKETKKILISEKKITNAEIVTARQNKKNKDKKTVYEMLLEGNSYETIASGIGESVTATKGLSKELQEEGIITKEEIEQARFIKNEQYKKELILNGLLKGLTWQEIVDSDEKQQITLQTVATWRKKLIESGEIKEEELDSIIKERLATQKEKRNEMYVAPTDKDIIKLMKLGFNYVQISELVGLSESYTMSRGAFLQRRGDISKEEVKNAVNNRRNNSKRRMQAIRKMQRYEEDIDILIIEEQIQYLQQIARLNLDDETITVSDITALADAILTDMCLINARNIKFIVTNYTRLGKCAQADRFIEQCLENLDRKNTKLIDALTKSKQEILNYSKRKKTKKVPPKPGDIGDGRE